MLHAKQEVRDMLVNRASMPVEQSIRVMFPYIYHANTPVERIEADMAVRLADYPDPKVYLGQLEGISQWQGCDRLHTLSIPTLILHGEHDQLVPSGNALLLAQHIKDSCVKLLPDASHVFTTDTPELAVKWIVEFLGEQVRGSG